jgi:hypothetical protein
MTPTNRLSPGQHRPRLGPACGVDQREGRVLGAVAGGVDRAHRDAAEPQLPAVIEGLVLVVGRREPMDVEPGTRGRGQPPVPGDVVGVVVRLEDGSTWTPA